VGIFDFFRSSPSHEQYAHLLIRAFADAGQVADLRYDPAEFRLVGAGDDALIVNLGNGYRAYCAAPRKQRKQVMAEFVQGMQTPALPAAFAEARARLLPVIRGRGTLEYLRLLPETLSAAKPYIDASAPLSGDSVVMLACDSERSIQTINGATLAGWGVSFEEAMAAATDNLRDASAANFEQIAPGIFAGAWGDSYESSRILFSDLFYRLELGGEPVVMAPTRHRLLVSSANNKAGLIGMLALARSFVQDEGRQVSALMYRFENGKPVEFVSDDGDVAQLAGELRKFFLLEDYHTQKQMLDKLNARAKLDLFVASYKLLQAEDTGLIQSYGVWTDKVDTLMPEVDKVTLVRYHEESGEPDIRVVDWAELRTQIKELRQSVEGYPARYRLTSFPSPEQLESLTTTDLNK
jgi:uncharacterized protein YtpQ (UPF0354 family)